MMLKFKRLQFSEYRDNKFLNSFGFNDLKNDLVNKKGKEGTINIYPISSDECFVWEIKKYFGKFIFQPQNKDLKIKFSDFKNSTLSLLRKFGVMIVHVELETGQNHKNKEIKEVWGYKLILIDNYYVLCEFLSSESIYNSYINMDSKPDYYKVYCGPDGKIFGWDKV